MRLQAESRQCCAAERVASCRSHAAAGSCWAGAAREIVTDTDFMWLRGGLLACLMSGWMWPMGCRACGGLRSPSARSLHSGSSTAMCTTSCTMHYGFMLYGCVRRVGCRCRSAKTRVRSASLRDTLLRLGCCPGSCWCCSASYHLVWLRARSYARRVPSTRRTCVVLYSQTLLCRKKPRFCRANIGASQSLKLNGQR